MSSKVRALALASGTVIALASPGMLYAQEAPAQAGVQARDFDIPAQPLGRAALRFSDQAGVQLVLGTDASEGLQANAVRGRFTVDEALGRMLAGTGLASRYLSAGVVTIERAGAPVLTGDAALDPEDRVIGAVNIQGQRSTAENGFAVIDGFGAGAGSNGSSDVTASEATGSLTTSGSIVASRSPQTLQETTQSVSVLTFERLKQQNITNLTEALNFAPGITVNTSTGTDSTILSRGYLVDTFSVDGGAPFVTIPNAQGSIELSQYDRVEVLRGSASQYGGSSGPGGIISLIRKRPLDRYQLNLEAGYGSYDDFRGEFDVTGPIGFNGGLRARFVLSGRDRDFFYDEAHQTRGSGYGVVEADLGSRTIVRAGGSYQMQRDSGLNLRGLPRFANGDALPLPRSTNFTVPFAEQDIDTTELFAALEHRFAEGWDLKLDATKRRTEGESLFPFFAVGQIFPSTVNPTISGTLTQAFSINKQLALSGTLNGRFSLFGLEQNVLVGAQFSEYKLDSNSILFTRPRFTGRVFDFDPRAFTERPGLSTPPSFAGNVSSTQRSLGDSELFGAYVTLALNPIERLRLTGGVRYNALKSTSAFFLTFPFGTFGGPGSFEEDDVSLNGSVSFDIQDWLAAYVSYNDIFSPQTTLVGPGPEFAPLTPARGQTIEGGLRFRLRDGKLTGSIAYYDTRQRDLSFQLLDDTGIPINPTNQIGCCFTQIARDRTRGVDVEVAGQLTDGWQVQASYNYNKNDKFGDPLPNRPGAFNTQQPRHEARLFTIYDLPGSLSRLTIGGGGRLQGRRSTSGTACTQLNAAGNACAPGSAGQFFSFAQPTYVVADAFLRYRIRDNVVVAFNVTNITDKRYFAQTGSSDSGNFYGEPRQFAVSIRTSLGDRR